MNHYTVLGLSSSATKDDIKKRYHELCLKHHPDINGGDGTSFKKIKESYEYLIKQKHTPTKSNYKEMFKSMRKSKHSQLLVISVSLEEAITDFEKKIKVSFEDPCPNCAYQKFRTCKICQGKGYTINEHEHIFKFKKPSMQNQLYTFKDVHEKITLIIKVHISNTSRYRIIKNNIEIREDLNIFKAILGGEYTVRTPYGNEILVLPPNKLSNYSCVLSNRGLSNKGKIIINFKINLSKNLTNQQREILNKLYEEIK